MSNPTRPQAPASKPAAVAADVTSIEVTSGITVESNDAVGAAAAPKLESIVSAHPVGIQIETFLGLQPNVDWVDPNAVAQPVAAGDE